MLFLPGLGELAPLLLTSAQDGAGYDFRLGVGHVS